MGQVVESHQLLGEVRRRRGTLEPGMAAGKGRNKGVPRH